MREKLPGILPEYGQAQGEWFAPQSSQRFQHESPFHEAEVLGEYGAALGVLSPPELKAVKVTSTFETGRTGGFDGLTGNMDGQGLSFRLMNFTIKAGSLIPLLQEFINKHSSRGDRHFKRTFPLEPRGVISSPRRPDGGAACRQQVSSRTADAAAVPAAERFAQGSRARLERRPWRRFATATRESREPLSMPPQ
jgi:hypothetical protein